MTALALEWVEARPDRPSFATGAVLTVPGALQLESGATIDARATALTATLRAGLHERLDLRLELDGTLTPDGGVDTVGFLAKIGVKPPPEEGLALALLPHAYVAVRDPAEHSLGLLAIASYFGDGFEIDADVGVDGSWSGEVEGSAVVNGSVPVAGPLSVYAEVYARMPCHDDACNLGRLAVGSGAAVVATRSLVLDAAVDVALAGEDRQLIFLVGLTTALGLR